MLGRAELVSAAARFPDDTRAETHVVAELQAGGLAVTIAGSVGGVGPDRVEYSLWGTRQSCRIVDWNRLLSSDGGDWEAQLTHIDDPRQLGYQLQLGNPTMGATVATLMFLIILVGVMIYFFVVQRRLQRYEL